MAEEPKPYTGTKRRNPDRSKYTVMQRPGALKPPPPDFRERFLELGYEVNWYYSCRWPVLARWIEECGGVELLAARREYLKKRGRIVNSSRHVKGWDAEKLEAMHREGNA